MVGEEECCGCCYIRVAKPIQRSSDRSFAPVGKGEVCERHQCRKRDEGSIDQYTGPSAWYGVPISQWNECQALPWNLRLKSIGRRCWSGDLGIWDRRVFWLGDCGSQLIDSCLAHENLNYTVCTCPYISWFVCCGQRAHVVCSFSKGIMTTKIFYLFAFMHKDRLFPQMNSNTVLDSPRTFAGLQIGGNV